jgi:D-lactate dehydrogenase
VSKPILHKLYYGHFFCHVFHQDCIVRKGHDTFEIEHRMWQLLDARGAQYPAEHNVGHLYNAKPALIDHYRDLDPRNIFNPAIGRTTKFAHWQCQPDPALLSKG